MSRRYAHFARSRRCFTLVELLVVITIIGIIVAMLVMALAGAAETARHARTTAQIAKINDVVMERWNSYRVRPIPIRMQEAGPRLGTPNPSPRQSARIRLWATWELMRMELPERKRDLIDLPGPPPGNQNWKVLKSPPALWNAYRARAFAQCGAAWQDDAAGWSPAHQGAECLYLIIATLRDGDTSALSHFSKSEIGDVDGDKMPEILDAWGNPIEFLRWAPAFIPAPLPPNILNARIDNPAPTKRQSGDPILQHCPFDVLKLYPEAYALYPLIFSAGPDRFYDIDPGAELPPSGGDPLDIVYSRLLPAPNNPYFTLSDAASAYSIPGTCRDSNQDGDLQWADNLTNHFTEVR